MDDQNQQPVVDQGGMPQAPVQPDPVPAAEPVAPVSEPAPMPAEQPVVPAEPVAPVSEPAPMPAEQPVKDPNQGGQQPGGTL